MGPAVTLLWTDAVRVVSLVAVSVVPFSAIVIVGAYLIPPPVTPEPVRAAVNDLVAAYRENIDAKDRLIEALRAKADAFQREAQAATTLATEREKTLALYRDRCPAP